MEHHERNMFYWRIRRLPSAAVHSKGVREQTLRPADEDERHEKINAHRGEPSSDRVSVRRGHQSFEQAGHVSTRQGVHDTHENRANDGTAHRADAPDNDDDKGEDENL